MIMNEFQLINLIVERLASVTEGEHVRVGPGDDAAVLMTEAASDVVVTTDTLVEGKHFPVGARADAIGYRAVAVNLSDLAAMGAFFPHLTIALTMPDAELDWIKAFVDGVVSCATEHGAVIVGGNLAKGPTNISVAAYGFVPSSQVLLRSGAKTDDEIWMSGKIGASLLALEKGADLDGSSLQSLIDRRDSSSVSCYYFPQPRLKLGKALRGIATSAIDISDGLIADLSHIAIASGCGAIVHLETVPVWPRMDILRAAGSDDSYELLFTAHIDSGEEIVRLSRQLDLGVSRIGRITQESGIRTVYKGLDVDVANGYQHF